VEHFPGLTPFDSLRSYAASGGHVGTTWFASATRAAEVSAWYEDRLHDHERRGPADWTRVEIRDGLRLIHGVTVHTAGTPGAGPTPSQSPPPGTLTVVRVDEGALLVAPPPPPPPPPARPSLLHRIRRRFTA
jgi:hypothetical protein